MTRGLIFHIIIFLITIFTLIIVCLILDNANAKNIIVAQDGNGDYEKIQDAIDNADEGDNIRVYEGTYYENVMVNKSVSLLGNGSEETRINGGGDGDVVYIKEDWVNFSGFHISGSGEETFDAGIEVNTGNNKIYNNICENTGMGISLFGASNTTLYNNIITSSIWVGIYFRQSENNILWNNTMVQTSISIDSYTIENWITHTIHVNNTVNNKPVYYYRDKSNSSVPKNAGQVILANCSEFSVENQNLNGGTSGILIGYSHHIGILNNTCWNNTWTGIIIVWSNDIQLYNNSCNNNLRGIGLFEVNNSTINKNYCEFNMYQGIRAYLM